MTTRIDPTTTEGARALERLADDVVGWLTTTDRDGRPQSSPIWFLWRDGEIVLCSYGRARRNDHLRERPSIAFNLNTDPTGDEVVSMEGTARFDPDGLSAAEEAAYLTKYGPRIAEYGWTVESFHADYPYVVRITPTRWRLA